MVALSRESVLFMERHHTGIFRSGEPPRQWREIQLVAARKLLRFFLPTLTIAGLVASLLCVYPQFYPARFAVSAAVVASTIPAWISMRRQRPLRGLVILLSALSAVLTVGTLMNGGPLAPAYTAMFVVLAAGVWFVPRFGTVAFIVGFLGLGLGSAHLMDAGVVTAKELPDRAWYAGILTVIAVVVAVSLSKIRALLHEALESSAKSYELLASVLGAIDDRLLLYSPERGECRPGMAHVNDLQVADLTLEAFLSLPLGDSADGPQDVRGLLDTTLERGTPTRHRVAVTTTTATTRYVEVTGVPVKGFGVAAHPEVAMLVRDVTDDELQRQHWTRSQKLEAIGSLASGIAHDFNNVLTGIRMSAELLKEENDLDGDPMLSLIVESTDRAALLTKRLLLHGRTQHDAQQAMDLMAIARETMALVRATLHPGVALDLEFEDEEIQMIGDPAALQGMLLNLALNAAHAVGQRGRIRLRVNQVPARAPELTRSPRLNAALPHVAIELMDDGCGIPEEMRADIFDAFVTTRPTGEGTGLGLWTTRNTVMEHGGEITLQSTVGLGTTFRILLPIHRGAALASSATRPAPHDPAITSRGSVMIIDDEPTIRRSLQLALNKRGFQATAFESGRQALAVLAHTETDVVILDMMMPEMTGYEIFQQIQTMDAPPKVILSTGFADLHEIAAMESEGLFATLNKPYPLERIVETLEAALATQRSTDIGSTTEAASMDHELAREFMQISRPSAPATQRAQHPHPDLAPRSPAPANTPELPGRHTLGQRH